MSSDSIKTTISKDDLIKSVVSGEDLININIINTTIHEYDSILHQIRENDLIKCTSNGCAIGSRSSFSFSLQERLPHSGSSSSSSSSKS